MSAFAVVLFSLCAAAPAPRVLTRALEPVGVAPETARAFDPLIAEAAQRAGAVVVSEADIQRLMELESNKQALGCDTTSSTCLAEIAGALGAELVLYGSVSQLGSVTQINLQLLDARSGNVQRDSLSVTDLGRAPQELRPKVAELIFGARPSAPQAVAAAAPSEPPWLAIGVLAGGGALTIAGAAIVAVAEVRARQKTLPGPDKQTAQYVGRAGIVGAALGAITLIVGGALFALGGDE